jgi:hypothetical protein
MFAYPLLYPHLGRRTVVPARWEDFKFGTEHLARWKRLAVVTGLARSAKRLKP